VHQLSFAILRRNKIKILQPLAVLYHQGIEFMSSQGHFDITAHQNTYASFIKASIVGTIAVASILSLMAFFLL
jgi:hypothetical protein